MVKVLAVNNYPGLERFRRVTDALAGAGAEVSSIGWQESSPRTFGVFDGVVLSGSPDMLSEPGVQRKYLPEIEAITGSKVPLLGICFGHQLIGRAFGSQVVKDREVVRRNVETTVLMPGGLFDGLPAKLWLAESREEIVSSLPQGFDLLARSETSPIAAIGHRSRALYGVQSHPERFSQENPAGGQIISNFLRLLG